MILNDNFTETRFRTFNVDGTLLEMGPEDEASLKTETGTPYTERLKKHIIEVHEEAHKVSTSLPVRRPAQSLL